MKIVRNLSEFSERLQSLDCSVLNLDSSLSLLIEMKKKKSTNPVTKDFKSLKYNKETWLPCFFPPFNKLSICSLLQL